MSETSVYISRKQQAIEYDLGIRDRTDYSTWSEVDANAVPIPTTDPSFNPAITPHQIAEATQTLDPHYKTSEALLYAAIYAGVQTTDQAAASWARLGSEYDPAQSFHFITSAFAPSEVPTAIRRTSLRAIPDSWQPDYRTPFEVSRSETEPNELTLAFIANETRIVVGGLRHLLPLDSARTISYQRAGRNEGDNALTINPVMTCPHRCQFCSRQYDEFNRAHPNEQRVPLTVLSPAEMVDHIVTKYPTAAWPTLNRVSLVTGSFRDYDEMEHYISQLLDELCIASHGAFAPRTNPQQELLVLTHLARTKKQFEALQKMGVAVQDTIEVIDDKQRMDIMPKASHKARVVPKYDQTFDQIVEATRVGTETLGPEKYRATIILGLDTYTVTANALLRLRDAGLKRIYTPLFQPYGYKDTELYKMSYPEAMRARKLARDVCSAVY